MGKRNSNGLFAAVAENVKEDTVLPNKDVDSKQANLSADTAVEKLLTENPVLPKTTMDRLESLSAFEAENARLATENSSLTDKIAEYLGEIDKLKKELKNANSRSNDTEDVLELKKANQNLEKTVSELQKAVEVASKENQQLKTAVAAAKANKPAVAPQQSFSKPKDFSHVRYQRTSTLTDGYSSWN